MLQLEIQITPNLIEYYKNWMESVAKSKYYSSYKPNWVNSRREADLLSKIGTHKKRTTITV